MKRFRSNKYRQWIASLPCIKCKKPNASQAAHLGVAGRGLKEDDFKCVPLCADTLDGLGCHSRRDQYLDLSYWQEKESMAENIALSLYDAYKRNNRHLWVSILKDI